MMGASPALSALLGTALRGLRSRLLLTAGSVLLAAIAVGAAVVGPMYQSGASSSYLVTKLQAEPNFITGVLFDYAPPAIGDTSVAAALMGGRRLADGTLDDNFMPAQASLWTVRRPSPTFGGDAALLSITGSCDHLVVTGRCPAAKGEAMILRQDSRFAHAPIGSDIKVSGVPGRLRVVGTYAAQAGAGTFWFDLADLQSVPAQPFAPLPTPYLPAPLIVSPQMFSSLTPGGWYVQLARRLDVTSRMSSQDLEQASHAVAALEHTIVDDKSTATLTRQVGNRLVPIAAEVRQRGATARATVAPAVVSVVLVALVLLVRLLGAAMELRRAELALASLRGYSREQLWVLGLVEPALTLALATPVGLVAGYVCYRALARTWLVPGLPIPLTAGSLLAVLVVLLATLAVAALVVRDSLSETLAQQIAGVRRPGRSGRWGILLRLVVVAAALAVLVATLAAGQQSSPDATDLALPILLAVAAGLVTTLAAQALARWWSSLTAGRHGVFSFLASRTISRRREGTLVILPLTAALAVSIFAAGVYTAAADWRGSDAATIVGADRSYPTKLSLGQAVALTHRLDPDGRWLMGAGANYEGPNQILIMDTPRLSRVGLWPASWTPGMSAADVQRILAPTRPSVTLTGSRLSMTVDNRVSGDYRTLAAEVSMTDENGEATSVFLGPMHPGVSTVSAHVDGCRSGCMLTQISFGGPAGISEAMHGTASITDVLMDDAPVPAFLDEPWRAADPLLDTASGVAGSPRTTGGRLTITFDARSSDSVAAVTPTDVPRVRPVLRGRTSTTATSGEVGRTIALKTSVYRTIAIRPVATTESMPVLGPAGLLVDYTTLTRDVTISGPSTDVTILARGDTPAAVLAGLADSGITDPVTVTTTRSVLDNDAFALALNLYLVVTAMVILLALAGLGASLTVQMPSRRRDAASLRVVGLRRRSIVAAVIAEFVVVMGAAALAGVGAGSLAQYVVVRTVTLGYADTQHTPRLLASLNVPTILALLLLVTIVLFVVAVLVAALTVRGARTASLRESAR